MEFLYGFIFLTPYKETFANHIMKKRENILNGFIGVEIFLNPIHPNLSFQPKTPLWKHQ
jgi:hypothetical protein